jgi:hypothetical protein
MSTENQSDAKQPHGYALENRSEIEQFYRKFPVVKAERLIGMASKILKIFKDETHFTAGTAEALLVIEFVGDVLRRSAQTEFISRQEEQNGI